MFLSIRLIILIMFFASPTGSFLRTLPAKHVEKIAAEMRKHNINALLIIGGFEVCFATLFFQVILSRFSYSVTL